ncbi:nuclease [bacterium I07]|nr:nuclease [bacterium I07]
MDRLITQKFIEWKDNPNRKPLLLRGARQVGKTWSVLDFGKRCFNGTVHLVDLEKHPDWHGIFEKNLEASRIISELELLIDASIQPGKDLLFFDEIQSCPRAVMALRYFYEEIPSLHVIAAGSLLEFAMRDISFPVGRVNNVNMHPMGFLEFLQATGNAKLSELLLQAPKKLSDTVHQALLEEVRRYMFVGGMPESVQRYSETGKIRDAFEVQAELVETFRQDFSKYAPLADKQCLNAVLSSVAKNVGRQIKYARLAGGFTNPTIKKAFNLLSLAQLFQKVSSVNPPVAPFGASVSESKFKTVLVDIGLMQQLCGLPVDMEFSKQDLLTIFEGAMAEQFVGQELLAAGEPKLYYWSREAKSSTAEVDYILTNGGRSVPVEVKSGPSGRLRSLHLFLKQYPESPKGYVLSCAPYAKLPKQKLVFLPLYYAYGLGFRA